jgi:hypothetical protein
MIGSSLDVSGGHKRRQGNPIILINISEARLTLKQGEARAAGPCHLLDTKGTGTGR